MQRVQWPLDRGRPVIQIALALADGVADEPRTLLADTGAGSTASNFELVLNQRDCLFYGGVPAQAVSLTGAYRGVFPAYWIRVRIAALNFNAPVLAVGIPSMPSGLDGIACFRFLNRFTYGNFGSPDQFGLDA